ncbi:condensation domain-containing protein [Paenibacillus polymyxa]|uniref:condensation domain-containing protein n=1 Tax=Paenibacillus polymyxa TaxID=1406 RepID=UPI003D26B2B3
MRDTFVEAILQLVAKQELSEEHAYSLIKQYQVQLKAASSSAVHEGINRNRDIAIIGVAGRFPQADTKEQYWNNLVHGLNGIRTFPSSRLELIRPFLDEHNQGPYMPAGYLDEIDTFDAAFFNILPGEAKYMDPQQRMFMETGYEAIEDAGYGGERIRGSRMGVYVGYSEARYKELIESDSSTAFVGNFPPVIASRLAYALNLSGPALSVATACSSSLVALHLACEGLLAGDCRLALVGGVAIGALPTRLEPGGLGITSSQGQSRSFDADADGTGWGEGCGVVLIKPLEQAEKDHDYIYSVIKASAINQDGASNGLASPNARAQEEVIVEAWKRAGIDPSTISYIEAHGTGTKIGDPIEIKGITNAFRRYTQKRQFCGIGSVKSNIGHLDSVSGMAGLIKMILALQHKKLPPTLHFAYPNPLMNLHSSPVYIHTKLADWRSEDGIPLRAGISSWGLSGTNCHVVLEEYPVSRPSLSSSSDVPCSEERVFTLSAYSEDSLRRLTARYIDFLESDDIPSLENICYVLNTGREHHAYRLAIPVSDRISLCSKLRQAYNALVCQDGTGLEQQGIFCTIYSEPLPLAEMTLDTDARMIARRYVNGENRRWLEDYSADGCVKVPLPTYAWDKQRYWVEPPIERRSRGRNEQLPAYNEVRVSFRDGYVPTETEDRLARIWGRILGIDELSIDANFFELGGDSLLATDLITAISQVFHTRITLVDLFGHPCIRELAKLVSGGETTDYPSIEPVSPQAFYPVSNAQRRQFILKQLAEDNLSYNMPGAAMITGRLDVERLKDAFAAIIHRHESFRTVFDVAEDEIVQIVLPEAELAISLGVTSEEADVQKLMEEFVQPFSLGEAPLLRVCLLRLTDQCDEEDKHLLMFDMHHIVSDGVSMEILIREFTSLYSGQSLPPLRIQYKDYAVWQNAFLHSEQLLKQEKFWLKTLTEGREAGLPVLSMPCDYPRPPVMTFEGGMYSFTIDKVAADRLRALGQEHGATLYMTLLAVYNVLLYQYTGQEDVIVGSLIAGRRYTGVEHTIGLFTNYLPIRNTPAGERCFTDFLKEVAHRTIAAYDHQDYPFEKMVEHLDQKRDLSRNPIFDTMLILHNQGMQRTQFTMGDVTLDMVDWAKHSSTMDLKLDIFQGMQGELNCTFEYYSRLFHQQTITTLAGHLLSLIDQILDQPEQALAEYRIFSPEEADNMKRKRRAKDSTFAIPPICPAPEIEWHPLSFYQKQLWRHRGSTPHMIVRAAWTGKVDQTLFVRVLEELQAEHSTLRIIFREETSEPTQQVKTHLPLDYTFTDVIEEDAASWADSSVAAEYRNPFEPRQGPLYRVRLGCDNNERCQLIVAVHPLLMECLDMKGWLERLFIRYSAAVTDSVVDAVHTFQSIPQIDFTYWQHQLLQEGYLEPQKAYWTEALRNPLPQIGLPFKRGEDASATSEWDSIEVTLATEETEALHSFASSHDSSVTDILFACYFLLLRQLTQAEELLVHVVHPEGHPVQGSGIPLRIQHPVPVRVSMEGLSSFNPLLEKVKDRYQAALQAVLYPFHLLLDPNVLKSGAEYSTRFNVIFCEEDCTSSLPVVGEVGLRVYPSEPAALQLSVVRLTTGLTCSLRWNTALLESSYVHSMLERYHKIIKTIAGSVSSLSKVSH